ncbi:MAG: efflux RND transporter permease subunit [Chitinophagaceae bacterium]|nr:MAG: efflux RND transporter permease subunit [Chitinophagaceae bacterium]
MSLSKISINRPVLASVMSIVIVLMGVIGYTYLGVREYPAVDPPRITVTTNYIGANADVIESQITEPLEESISGIAGIESLNSVNNEGRSTITVEFDLSIDLEAAANDVRDRVSRAVRNLPPDAEPPIVAKADADASPIVFLNIQSAERDYLELTAIAENNFKERVQTIPGVSEVRIWGSKTYSMRLWLDPGLMAAYGVTPIDVRNAVNQENVELPSGRIEGTHMELTVRTMGRLNTPEEYNDLIILDDGINLVRLRDVGHAEYGPENERTVLKRDGVAMVGIVLIPQPGSNHVEIVDEFYERLKIIERDLPEDIKTDLGFDNTVYIRASIGEVQQSVFLAFGLVILVIFFFLRDWRTSIIPIITIPIALIGSFFIMYIAGFSINILTMLAVVLAIGLVVDDAIVVLENIYTKIEKGIAPKEAAIQGVGEIFFAVVTTTIALAAIFLPVIFLEGITGRLFREFGITLAGAVIISSFVALTLAPMLCSKILKKKDKPSWFYQKTERHFEALTNLYARVLDFILKFRSIALMVIVLSGFAMYFFYSNLQQELAPLEDRSDVRAFFTGPEGATFEYMDHFMDKVILEMRDSIPEMEAVISVTSPGFGASTAVNSGFMRLILKDPSERERSQNEVFFDVSNRLRQFSEARGFASQPQTIGGGFQSFPVQYVLLAPNFERLTEVLPEFLEQANQEEALQFADANLKFNKPEIQIEINRSLARSLGISIRDISETLQSAFSGQRFGFFLKDGKQYQVIGQLPRINRNEPTDISSLYIRSGAGELVQLSSLITLKETSAPPQRFRYNRFVSATIQAGLKEGYTIADGIAAMDAVAARVLDDSFSTDLTGPSKDYADSSASLIFAFVLALIFVFLLLSAQFESFKDPLIVMFTVPLAIAGALFSLWYFGQTLNIFSQIGIIMLIGLVSKNGILIVEFANQRKQAGLEFTEAIRDASIARFRPILMTSISTILGILPIALSLGAGSESRQSMGIGIIGGLMFSTILTLFVIPAMYTFISTKYSTKSIDTPENKQLETV